MTSFRMPVYCEICGKFTFKSNNAFEGSDGEPISWTDGLYYVDDLDGSIEAAIDVCVVRLKSRPNQRRRASL